LKREYREYRSREHRIKHSRYRYSGDARKFMKKAEKMMLPEQGETIVQEDYTLGLLDMKTPDGRTLTVAEKIATLSPALIERMFGTYKELGEDRGQRRMLNEVVCRLLASGMPAPEIVMILNVKTEVVDDAVKYKKELIAKYARQLEGRRKRANSKPLNEGGSNENGGG